MTTKEDNIMIYKTEDDLNTLLDSLTEGEHIKATWVYDCEHTMTIEGPVNIDDRILQCDRPIRWEDGMINPYLTSLEAAGEEEVTVVRDNEKALHELLDSLKEGETVTAEWRNRDGSMTLTGPVQASGLHREVDGYHYGALRRHSGPLHPALHSVTVRRTVVKRWERDGDE